MLLRDNTRDQHVNTSLDHVSCHAVEGPMTSGSFFHFVAEEKKKKKKKEDKKTKAFYDWATTGILLLPKYV